MGNAWMSLIFGNHDEFGYMFPSKFRIIPHRSPLYAKYKISNEIYGTGRYGIIRKGISKETGEVVAIKTMKKRDFIDLDRLEQEVIILSKLGHPNIINYIEYVNDSEYFHIVTDFYSGGELFDRLKQKGPYSELETSEILFDLLSAIKYCHSRGIVHRDIKLENLLYESHELDAKIKLVDFGLSKLLSTNDLMMHTQVGTSYYVAPEVLKGSYSAESDLWSLGIVAYILLCGYPPFRGTNDFMIFRKIEQGSLTFPIEHWSNISQECKSLISGLLTSDPKNRLTADEAIKHVWFSPLYKKASRELNSVLDSTNMTLSSKIGLEDLNTLYKNGFTILPSILSQYFQYNTESSTLQDIYNYIANKLGMMI